MNGEHKRRKWRKEEREVGWAMKWVRSVGESEVGSSGRIRKEGNDDDDVTRRMESIAVIVRACDDDDDLL